MELAMTTVISEDRLGRFAEVDHEVLEEVRAIVEAEDGSAIQRSPGAARRALQRMLTTLRATIRLSQRS
jgi:hypothetical protein